MAFAGTSTRRLVPAWQAQSDWKPSKSAASHLLAIRITFTRKSPETQAATVRPATAKPRAFGLYSQLSPAGLYVDLANSDVQLSVPCIPARCNAAFPGHSAEEAAQEGSDPHGGFHSSIFDKASNSKEIHECPSSSDVPTFLSLSHPSSTRIMTWLHRTVQLSKEVLAQIATPEAAAKAFLTLLITGVFFSSQRWAQVMLGLGTALAGVVLIVERMKARRTDRQRWESRRKRVVAHEAGHFLL
jgi:hypothetical protein